MDIQGVGMFFESIFVSGEAIMVVLSLASFLVGYETFLGSIRERLPLSVFFLSAIATCLVLYSSSEEYRLLIFLKYLCTVFAWFIAGLIMANAFSRRKTERLLAKAIILKNEKGEGKVWIGDLSDFEVRLLRYFLYYEVYDGAERESHSLGKILENKNQNIETGRNQVEWSLQSCRNSHQGDKCPRLLIEGAWPFYDDNEVIVIDGEKLNIRLW